MSTIFSKIVAGEVPADIVYRDDRVTAFRDINPAAPTHILIIPNREIPTVNDLADEDAALAGHMLLVARDLARSEGIAESGYRLIINCNRRRQPGGVPPPHAPHRRTAARRDGEARVARKFHRFAKRGRGGGWFRKANASQGAQAYP